MAGWDKTGQVIAGTAGVPPAMSAKREKDWQKRIPNTARLRRVAGGTPAVPANHSTGFIQICVVAESVLS